MNSSKYNSDNDEVDGEVGPGAPLKLNITPALSNLLLSHAKYQSQLSIWKQYMIWRYTMGSGSLNKYLIGNPIPENQIWWTYYLFSWYNVEQYGLNNIEFPFSKWKDYFENPDDFLDLSDDSIIDISNQIIEEFALQLQNIILEAPATQGKITVYKMSSSYPGLPTNISSGKDVEVKQSPFNSSTYDPQFNFAPFLSDESNFFTIDIPKGSHVLAISTALHAYPHELEILIPFDSSFYIHDIGTEIVDYISTKDQTFVKVQNGSYVIGQVYRVNPVCYNRIKQRTMQSFIAELDTNI
jgi:hypothetical protein